MSAIQPLPSFDIQSLTDVDSALEALDSNLEALIRMCYAQPVFSAKDKKTMEDNVVFLKRYYERTERLLLDEQGNERGASSPPASDVVN